MCDWGVIGNLGWDVAVGRSGLGEAGIGTGCLVGGRAAPGRGPGCVGRHGCRRGCGASGVHRSTVHRWVARYLGEGIGGLSDRSHRPLSCPWQAAEVVEVAVAEMRVAYPRWGSRRIRLELLRRPAWSDETVAVPSSARSTGSCCGVVCCANVPRNGPGSRSDSSGPGRCSCGASTSWVASTGRRGHRGGARGQDRDRGR